MKTTGWTALTIAFLLAGSGLATAQTERAITARELQQFNPQTIEAITRETVSDRPASATAQRDARLTVRSPIEPTVVKLTPERGAEPQQLSLGITRPRLQLNIGQDTILGYGLESATVTVQAEGAASLPTEAISISSQTGYLDQMSSDR